MKEESDYYMEGILALIINFDKKTIKNDKTGEIKIMFEVRYAVDTDSYKDHYGPTILVSYADENAFNVLNANLGKKVKINLSEKSIFGKPNTYKKVVSKINGVDIRKF